MSPKHFISAAGMAGASDARLASPKKLSSTLMRLAEWLTLAAAVAVPLFYLTATSNALELPKQAVIMALVGSAFLAWIGSMLAGRAIVLRRTVANPVVAVLLAAVAISAAASVSRYASLVGDGGQEYQSLVTTALFCALFAVTTGVGDAKQFARRALIALTLAGGLVSLLAVLQYSGIKALPFVSDKSFNLIGSTVVLGLSAAVTVVMAAAWFLVEEGGRLAKARLIAAGASGLCALALAFLIDFWPIWAAIIVGLVAVLAYSVIRPQAVRRLALLGIPMAALILSALMLFVNAKPLVSVPVEIFPDLRQSLKVSRDALVSHPVFGTGPGTYFLDYAAHRGQEVNKGALWYLTFDRGESFLITAAATLGLAGLAAWAAVLVVGIWKSAAFLLAGRKDESAWLAALAVSAAWLASAAGLAFYGASIATLFVFWLLFGILIRLTSPETVEVKFSSSPRAALALTFAFVGLVVLALVGWFVTGTRLYADIRFAQAMNMDSSKDIDKVISGLQASLDAVPDSAATARSLSQAEITKAQQLIAAGGKDAAELGRKIGPFVDGAVKAAQLATQIGPQDPLNWEQLGSVYEAAAQLSGDAGSQALEAYSRAADLNPVTPVYRTAMARVDFFAAGLAASERDAAKDDAAKAAASKKFDEALSRAESEIGKALALKPDYAPAGYQLALVKDAQGKTAEAVAKMQEVSSANPSDAGVSYQLAAMYYRDGQKDKAQSELERIIAVVPDYANARWFLAGIYEEKKMYDEAIAQVEAVLKANPDNKDTQAKLQVLKDEKDGKAAESGDSGKPSPSRK